MSKSHSKKATVTFRYYCQECVIYLETWVDGSKWTIDEQQNYALGKEELDLGI
jgi:hypothetical protein